MPIDRQVAQLLLQVDANIAVAQREIQNLARVVNQSSGQMNTALDSTARAHARLDGAFNNTRIAQMELTHVVTASVDAYAAGFSPIRILTLEMGRLAQAATFLGGSGGTGVLGRLAGFMGGPWGIAVLLGVNVLAQLFMKMDHGTESVSALVQKMREHAREAANSKAADEEWAKSIDGLIERNEKLTDDLKKRLKAEEDLDAQTLANAQHDKATAEQALAQDKVRLANLQRQLAIAKASNAVPNAPGAVVSTTNTGQIQALEREIAKVRQDIEKQQQGIASAQQAIVQSQIAVGEQLGKASADSSAAVDLWAKNILVALHAVENAQPAATATISGAFDILRKAMEDAASAGVNFKTTGHQADDLVRQLASGKIAPLQFASALKELAKQLEAVAEAAKNAKKGTGEFGKEVSFADAEAIAKGAGLTVTSGYRSRAKQAELYNTVRSAANPVAKPGTSAHEGINGKWALDIAFAPGLTPERLRRIYGDHGVSLSAIYKESGHFHIEGSRSQAAAADRQAQRDQVADIRQQSAFDQASDRLDQELLQAKAQLAGDYNARAQIADEQVSAETKKLNDSIQEQLDLGKATDYQQGITETQAQILRAKTAELDKAKKAAIELQRYLQALESIQQTTDQRYTFAANDLHFADEMARTQSDHRRIQLELLEITYQQKEYDLRILLAKQQLAGDLEAAARTQAEINRLPQEKAQDQERVRQGTLNPLEQWAKSVPKTAQEVIEALQSIEAQGLDHLASAITDVITGTRSLKDAFKDVAQSIIADIIQMTIRMLIFRAISSALGGVFGGGGGAGGPISVSSGTSSYFASNPFGGFKAGGGSVGAGTAYIVGEKGPELFVPSANGTIVPKVPRISIPQAANSNQAPQKTIVELRLDDDMLHARIIEGAGQVVIAAAPAIVKSAGRNTVKSLTRPSIAGGG